MDVPEIDIAEAVRRIDAGTPRLALGQLDIRSRLTHAQKTYCFAVLYLGQQHIIGNISATMNRTTFDAMWQRTSKAFNIANLGEVIGILQEYFGPEKFTLASLFADEKIKIIREITESGLASAESSFRSVFDSNYQLMTGLEEADLPLPDAWRNIAAYVLNADLLNYFKNGDTKDVRTLLRVSNNLKRWQVKLNDEDAVRHAISERIYREIERIDLDESSAPRVEWLNDVLLIVQKMNLKPDVWKSQNVFYLLTKGYRKGQWVFVNEEWKAAFEHLAGLLKVRLKV